MRGGAQAGRQTGGRWAVGDASGSWHEPCITLSFSKEAALMAASKPEPDMVSARERERERERERGMSVEL